MTEREAARRRARRYRLAAEGHLAAGQLVEAAAGFEKATHEIQDELECAALAEARLEVAELWLGAARLDAAEAQLSLAEDALDRTATLEPLSDLRAQCVLLRAQILVVRGDQRHAYGYLVDLLDSLGTARSGARARCQHQLGRLLDDVGEHEEAVVHLSEARAYFADFLLERATAHCDAALGSAEFQRGEFDAAIDALRSAEVCFQSVGDSHEALNARGNLGLVLAGLGRMEEALPYVEEAREAAKTSGRVSELVRWSMNLGVLSRLAGRFEEAGSLLAEAADLAGRSGLGFESLCLAFDMAGAELARGNIARAASTLERARRGFEDLGAEEKMAACECVLASLAAAMGDRPKATRCFERARKLFARRGALLPEAICHDGLARIHRAEGRIEEALREALASLTILDAHRYRLRRSPLRQSWSERHAGSYGLAFELAFELGDEVLVAELVESARVQGVPVLESAAALEQAASLSLALSAPEVFGLRDAGALHAGLSQAEPAVGDRGVYSSALVAIGELPIAPAPLVTVCGRSRLGEAYPGRAHSRNVALEEAAFQAAGRQAWWWGSWVSGASLFWSLVGPLGRCEAGRLDLGAGSDLDRALDDLRSSLAMVSEDRAGAEMKPWKSALWSDADLEESIMCRLGSALLPPLLSSVLEEAASRDEVVDLVIAPAAQVAWVPFGLLAWGGQAPDLPQRAENRGARRRGSTRVLEAARVRLAPSAALVCGLAARSAPAPPTGIRRPVVVSVLDPTSDLPNARGVPSGTQRLLGGRAVVERGAVVTEVHLAVRDELRQVLEEVSVGTLEHRGVLVYRGHASSPAPGRTAGAALALADGDVTAKDLLTWAQESPGLIPDRVLLAGCASLGAAHGGAEWMSLAPAALVSGATAVVATSWALLDHPIATEVEQEIVAVLRTADDVAGGLRALQCRWLERWRTARVHVASGRVEQPAAARPPLIWAAFALVAVSGSSDELRSSRPTNPVDRGDSTDGKTTHGDER